MALILIAGVPGTGKTTIGDHLRDAHGYRHLDVEAEVLPTPALNARWSRSPSAFLAAMGASDLVATWGFMPGRQEPLVADILKAGAIFVWFDGNRAAARRAFNRRGTVPEYLFNAQMWQIEHFSPVARFRPTVINTFVDAANPAAAFRDKEAVAQEILRLVEGS